MCLEDSAEAAECFEVDIRGGVVEEAEEELSCLVDALVAVGV